MLQYWAMENMAKYHGKSLRYKEEGITKENEQEIKGFEYKKGERGKRFEEKGRDKFLFGENN